MIQVDSELQTDHSSEASVHSRSARRAASPSIDIDKSLKEIKPPPPSKNHRPAILAIHQGAGVSKKIKNGRKSVMSARAKARQEKVLDRAEVVMDQKAKKIEKSKGRARNVQDRAETWEQRNKRIEDAKTEAEALQRAKAAYLAAGEEEEENGEQGKMDLEAGKNTMSGNANREAQSLEGDVNMQGNTFNPVTASVSLPSKNIEGEEEIL